MSLQYHVEQTWLKAPEELIFYYQITQNLASKMHYIYPSLEEIYSILKMYVLMVIILKQ